LESRFPSNAHSSDTYSTSSTESVSDVIWKAPFSKAKARNGASGEISIALLTPGELAPDYADLKHDSKKLPRQDAKELPRQEAKESEEFDACDGPASHVPPTTTKRKRAQIQVGSKFRDSSDDEEYVVMEVKKNQVVTVTTKTNLPHPNANKQEWDCEYVMAKQSKVKTNRELAGLHEDLSPRAGYPSGLSRLSTSSRRERRRLISTVE
jgi:hypothetical protein